MTNINFHQTVKVEQTILKFDSFTIYRYIATDRKGHSLEFDLYHQHNYDSLTFEPILYVDNTTEEKTNANE